MKMKRDVLIAKYKRYFKKSGRVFSIKKYEQKYYVYDDIYEIAFGGFLV